MLGASPPSLKNIKRNCARIVAGDVPGNILEALLASILLALVSLASVLSASVSLASVSLASVSLASVSLAQSCHEEARRLDGITVVCLLGLGETGLFVQSLSVGSPFSGSIPPGRKTIKQSSLRRGGLWGLPKAMQLKLALASSALALALAMTSSLLEERLSNRAEAE